MVHLLESSGQAGCSVYLIFLFKKTCVFNFKLNLNMTTHLAPLTEVTAIKTKVIFYYMIGNHTFFIGT